MSFEHKRQSPVWLTVSVLYSRVPVPRKWLMIQVLVWCNSREIIEVLKRSAVPRIALVMSLQEWQTHVGYYTNFEKVLPARTRVYFIFSSFRRLGNFIACTGLKILFLVSPRSFYTLRSVGLQLFAIFDYLKTLVWENRGWHPSILTSALRGNMIALQSIKATPYSLRRRLPGCDREKFLICWVLNPVRHLAHSQSL